MPEIMKAACLQINAGPDISENLKAIEPMIRKAAGQGAQFIATPEMTDSLRRYAKDKLADGSDEEHHEGVKLFAALAKELNIHLLAGSFGVKILDPSLHGLSVQSPDHTDKPCDDEKNYKLANRSLLFAPDGKIKARYDKMHMFDVKLSRTEFYNESKDYQAGEKAIIAGCGAFKLGMGVCYDVRFPYLWRDLAKAGADILSVPAAFTVPTGKAHWEVLLRARAIETGCFVVASAQVGEHEGGRKTYGHSLIINPWGEILAASGTEIGIIMADLDLSEVEKARAAIPALQHDRDYVLEST